MPNEHGGKGTRILLGIRAMTDRMPGLTATEAAARLQRDGPNALPDPGRKRRWAIVVDVLREPMLLLLAAAAGIYMLLGDPQEASLLLASVMLVIGLTVYQEYKSERALQALREQVTSKGGTTAEAVAPLSAHSCSMGHNSSARLTNAASSASPPAPTKTGAAYSS